MTTNEDGSQTTIHFSNTYIEFIEYPHAGSIPAEVMLKLMPVPGIILKSAGIPSGFAVDPKRLDVPVRLVTGQEINARLLEPVYDL